MSTGVETVEDVDPEAAPTTPSRPGVVLIHAAGTPTSIVLAVDDALAFGRDQLAAFGVADDRASREHIRLTRRRGRIWLEDLGSRNGTWHNGAHVPPRNSVRLASDDVVRIGQSLLLAVDDVSAFDASPIDQVDGFVRGPRTARALHEIARHAQSSRHLLIQGQSGVGKEHAAQHFHRSGPGADGPLVAINCAAIPTTLAERVLFGSREGAYSGATRAEGHVQAARGGTLFLDEIGELDLATQAKLLRVVETGEVVAVGAARPETIDVRFCLATHRDLAREVAGGRFRHDLHYRIAQPVVHLGPLTERREEIPWLATLALAEHELTLHAGFVEACLLHSWPGNVRELLHAVRTAAASAASAGRSVVIATDLKVLDEGELGSREPSRTLPSDEIVERTLAEHEGNVSAAARSLGVHRTQLRRWLERRQT